MKRNWAPLLLLLAVPLTAQQPAATPARDKCMIRGVARYAGSNLPVRRAVVELRSKLRKLRQATTDSQGRFELKNLEPGDYLFSVRREGQVLQRVHLGFRQVPGRAPFPLALTPGKDLTGIVAYFLPPAVLAGRILDAEGEPMNAVSVEVVRVPRGGKVRWGGGASGTAETNDLGEFRIAGLTPGTYHLLATPLGENARADLPPGTSEEVRPEAFVYPPTYYPGVTDRKQASPLVLRAGEQMPLELILRPVRAVRVRGRVLGIPEGTPSASVVLRPRDGTLAMYDALAKAEDGVFEFEAIPPGSYAVRAFAAASEFLGGNLAEGRGRLEVESDDIEGFTVMLAPFGKTNVQGRVRLPGESVLRPNRFVVHLKPLEEEEDAVREPPRYVEPVTVQLDGTFEVKEVYDGRYRVLFSLRGEQPDDQDLYLKSATIAEEDVLEEGVLVAEGRVAGRLDLLISSAGGRIEGMVLGLDRLPAAGAHVVVAREERDQRRSPFSTLVTDQEGRFLVRGLPPGDYRLYAWDRVYEEEAPWADSELLNTPEDDAPSLTVNENERKKIELKALKLKEE